MSIPEGRDVSAWLEQERAHPLNEGAAVGRYQITGIADADAISITYTAQDSEQSREVLLREFLPCLISRRDPDGSVRAAFHDCQEAFDWARETFLREGQAQIRVHHPSLAPVTALQTVNGSSYLAVVPVEGHSLATVIGHHGKLGAQEIQELSAPLLEALKALHAVDQFHFGIAPDNVRITVEGTPVLAPAARAAVDLAAGLELGDVDRSPYTPPEWLVPEGEGYSGPQSDIYALAATLYTAAAGQAPVSAADRLSALAAGEDDPYEPIELHADGALPAVAAAAINDALGLDPRKRPASVVAWKQRFEGRRSTPAVIETPEAQAAVVATAAQARPAKLDAAISPPARAIQPELPLPAAQPRPAPVAEAPVQPMAAAARKETPEETLVVRPRRAAQAVASVAQAARQSVSERVGDGAKEGMTRHLAGARRGLGGAASWAGKAVRVAGRFLARGAAVVAAMIAGLLRYVPWHDRRVQIGGGALAAILVLVVGALVITSGTGPLGGRNVTAMKVAGKETKDPAGATPKAGATPDTDADADAKAAARKAAEAARKAEAERKAAEARDAEAKDAEAKRQAADAKRKAAEKAESEKAEAERSAAEKAAAEKAAAEKAERRKVLEARWVEIQELKGDDRVAAEKAYFEKALSEFSEEATAWHDNAIASHRDGDFQKAFELYRKAAGVGHLGAQVSLGFLYVKGQGTKADPALAAAWFRRAAERGNRVAQSNLAGQYTTGRGVKRDFKAALRWAKAAAEQSDPTAHGRIGFLYRYGLGVKKNPRKALAWYRKGAALGHVWSMAEIGAMYEAGEGVRRDAKTAAKWYRRARRNGSQYAERRLDAMRRN